MALTHLGGNPVHTNGDLPAVGSDAPDFNLLNNDLVRVSMADYGDSTLVVSIFPSVDTGVCATSVLTFNERAGALSGVKVLNVSADLPFAQKRFCGAEGIENVETLSTFGSEFLSDYGVQIEDGPFAGLAARAVVVLKGGKVMHAELVPEIGQEPNYDAALAAAK
ncbi:MAG: thiol peroxidase [Flavobacteriales bacterium]|jgi:thiol peroxidase